MNTLALVLVLAAALAHATWNLVSKKAAGSPRFVWIYCTVAAVLYAPLALVVVLFRPQPFGFLQVIFVLGSALIHSAYFLFLQRGYRVGDFSLIYPLARGSGSIFSAIAAVLFFGERPGWLASVGAVVVAVSILFLASSAPGAHSRKEILFGLLTGLSIALYTLWDKHAVSKLGVSPIVMEWGTTVGLALLLAPTAVTNWKDVRHEWALHRRHALGIGVLSPLAYILVLTALVFSPVSYIAPAREVSILIGAAMGTRLLAESSPRRRLVAATMMVLGLLALAVG